NREKLLHVAGNHFQIQGINAGRIDAHRHFIGLQDAQSMFGERYNVWSPKGVDDGCFHVSLSKEVSGLRRELAELEKQAEPVLHMPCGGHEIAVDYVELMQAKADLFSGRRDAEEL